MGPLLRPAWRLLLISCSIRTTGQVHNMRRVYRGWIKQPCKCSKQSACSPEPQYVPDIPVFMSIYLFTPACPVRASYLLIHTLFQLKRLELSKFEKLVYVFEIERNLE